MNWKWILALVILLLLVIFAVQNSEVVEVKLFFWTLSMSRALIIISTLCIGVVLGWITLMMTTDWKKWYQKMQKKENRKKQSDMK